MRLLKISSKTMYIFWLINVSLWMFCPTILTSRLTEIENWDPGTPSKHSVEMSAWPLQPYRPVTVAERAMSFNDLRSNKTALSIMYDPSSPAHIWNFRYADDHNMKYTHVTNELALIVTNNGESCHMVSQYWMLHHLKAGRASTGFPNPPSLLLWRRRNWPGLGLQRMIYVDTDLF